ncbi:uncharacterized protein BX664DRAFT_389705 [Halteromyces radiatus]|uniref:uncharacterized protein n=1 Tax=Halteromyces radiatus TaxID=101107 RepID=UPI00221FC968|nr:uncharacterized protein BX664DRAFT_389705 [Halteromyces radiatus]KAI8075978.1 hypothetical protein BX664DRAFT_389705 [Halteromyces radiatus]
MNDYYEDLKADPKSFFSNINNALRKGGYRGVFKNGNIFAQVMTGGPQKRINNDPSYRGIKPKWQHLADEDKDDAMTKINDMVKKCSIYGDLVEAAGGPWILCLADLYPDSYLTKVSKGAMVRAAESLCIDGLRTEFGSRFAGLFF